MPQTIGAQNYDSSGLPCDTSGLPRERPECMKDPSWPSRSLGWHGYPEDFHSAHLVQAFRISRRALHGIELKRSPAARYADSTSGAPDGDLNA